VDLYRRNVEAFLQDLREDAMPDRFAALSPLRVREYLRQQAPQFARVTRKSLVITLRSFLRFAFGAGYLQRDAHADTATRRAAVGHGGNFLAEGSRRLAGETGGGSDRPGSD